MCGSYSYVDLNKAEVHWIEIISKPGMRTSIEVVEYVAKVLCLVHSLGLDNDNMKELLLILVK